MSWLSAKKGDISHFLQIFLLSSVSSLPGWWIQHVQCWMIFYQMFGSIRITPRWAFWVDELKTYVLWWYEDDAYEDVDVDEKRGVVLVIVLVLLMCFCGLEFFFWVWKWGVSPALEASLLTGRSLWQFPGLRWAWCWWRWRVDWCCIVDLYILRLGGWVGNMWCFDVQLDTWESTYFFLFWTHESNFYLVGDGFFRNLFGGRNHCQKPQVRFLAVWFVLRPAT